MGLCYNCFSRYSADIRKTTALETNTLEATTCALLIAPVLKAAENTPRNISTEFNFHLFLNKFQLYIYRYIYIYKNIAKIEALL